MNADELALYVRAGRTPIKIKMFNSYEEPDNWDVVPVAKANAWSSRCRIDDRYHMPCFDVDIDKDTYEWFVEAIDRTKCSAYPIRYWVEREFPDAGWVPSSTEGHWHVYSDTPIAWDEYMARLGRLVDMGIVESGYRYCSIKNRGTHLRMPHVKKSDMIIPIKHRQRPERTGKHNVLLVVRDHNMWYMWHIPGVDERKNKAFVRETLVDDQGRSMRYIYIVSKSKMIRP